VDADIAALREEYLNKDFDRTEFEIDPVRFVDFAKACGETESRYIDPDDPDFQALPTFPCSLMGGRSRPQGFPTFGGIGMDGGKAVEPLKPIRPGVKLVGKTHLHDIYTKTGRSGRMIFLVSRMEIYDADGEHLSNADTRIVIREKTQD